MVQVENAARQSPDDITNLFVKAADKDGTLVPLSELVVINSRSGPVEIQHTNRMRSVMLSGVLKPEYSMKDGINLVETISKDLTTTDYRIDFMGEAKRFLTEGPMMLLVFGLAIAFIYLIMAAQFESWRDPFIIIVIMNIINQISFRLSCCFIYYLFKHAYYVLFWSLLLEIFTLLSFFSEFDYRRKSKSIPESSKFL